MFRRAWSWAPSTISVTILEPFHGEFSTRVLERYQHKLSLSQSGSVWSGMNVFGIGLLFVLLVGCSLFGKSVPSTFRHLFAFLVDRVVFRLIYRTRPVRRPSLHHGTEEQGSFRWRGRAVWLGLLERRQPKTILIVWLCKRKHWS